jgi:hypothetical protein
VAPREVRPNEVKEIRDKARALEVYASQAMNRDSEQKAAAIRIRAERKAGELLIETKANGQRQSRSQPLKVNVESSDIKSPILSDLGISRDQSSQWQKRRTLRHFLISISPVTNPHSGKSVGRSDTF